MAARPPAFAPALRFTKMHGAGNDFVVLDLRHDATPPSPDLCRALADRHAGVGCDQILTVEAPASAAAIASYRIWNADGSPSQQCGNGARCVAAWLVRDGATESTTFELDSPTGTHAVEALDDGRYRIAMGVPEFEPRAIGLNGFDAARDEYDIALDEDLKLRFGAVSTGNPHAVVEVADVDDIPVSRYGSALQQSSAFTESANVGFAQVVARDRIRLRVFERGVGETLACGSGACAAAVAAIRRGLATSPVAVHARGGRLDIAWNGDRVLMTGPAATVFEGEFDLAAISPVEAE